MSDRNFLPPEGLINKGLITPPDSGIRPKNKDADPKKFTEAMKRDRHVKTDTDQKSRQHHEQDEPAAKQVVKKEIQKEPSPSANNSVYDVQKAKKRPMPAHPQAPSTQTRTIEKTPLDLQSVDWDNDFELPLPATPLPIPPPKASKVASSLPQKRALPLNTPPPSAKNPTEELVLTYQNPQDIEKEDSIEDLPLGLPEAEPLRETTPPLPQEVEVIDTAHEPKAAPAPASISIPEENPTLTAADSTPPPSPKLESQPILSTPQVPPEKEPIKPSESPQNTPVEALDLPDEDEEEEEDMDQMPLNTLAKNIPVLEKKDLPNVPTEPIQNTEPKPLKKGEEEKPLPKNTKPQTPSISTKEQMKTQDLEDQESIDPLSSTSLSAVEREDLSQEDDDTEDDTEEHPQALSGPQFFQLSPFPTVEMPLSYAALPVQVYALFEKLLLGLTVVQAQDMQKTTLILQGDKFSASVFSGAQITIVEFKHAPRIYNIEMTGSAEAIKLFHANKGKLEAAFQSTNKKDFPFDVHLITVLEDTTQPGDSTL